MVHKLRKKFVITATLSLLVILVVMIAIINIINLHQVIRDADNLLVTLSENNGLFPPMMGPPKDPNKPQAPPSILSWEFINNIRSTEMPYQARYFWVAIKSDGTVDKFDIGHVAAISEETATDYALTVFNSRKTKGFLHSYRYLKSVKDNGNTFIVFLDISNSIFNAYHLLIQSLIVGLCALLAMFILVFIFSSQAVAPYVESLEKQKRFITDAGHELKTPLAVISANIDVLELENGKNEWTSSIRNQTKRLNSLIKNLLTLARMDEEKMKVVFSDFDMSKTIQEAADSFAPIAEAGEKKYQIDIEENIHIKGDKNAINQLASLLLDNALKYSPDKGSVHVTLSRSKNITFEVSNTCDSIPTGNLDRLFDRFYRADSSRSRETGGYGIGLSVARAIATSHGGKIEALRDGDRIIRFVVTLPIKTEEKKS